MCGGPDCELQTSSGEFDHDVQYSFDSIDELIVYLNELQYIPVGLLKLTGDIVHEAKMRYDATRFRERQLRRLVKIAVEGSAAPLDEFILQTEAFLDECLEALCDAADRVHGDGRPMLK
jgi:hypothetical protein